MSHTDSTSPLETPESIAARAAQLGDEVDGLYFAPIDEENRAALSLADDELELYLDTHRDVLKSETRWAGYYADKDNRGDPIHLGEEALEVGRQLEAPHPGDDAPSF